MTEAIQIPRKIANQLLHNAQLAPEQEVCGLVGAISGVPTRCYPITNIAELPEQRFLLDPAQQIAAFSTMRGHGESLFAIYHSHPHAPALPSATDLELAAYPDALYLIISLDTKGILEMRGFYLHGHSSREVSLVLSEA
ncbi:M67 family metallopeptidase [Methylovulum psychrotolerans]|uniref:CysO-cysteine peptidase n=1 Tax=Methylovulum psychrotolerans TaxID=1704499 RepID=A0A2S5CQS1_9GAMM|nr:M67 family metallopeptidase [Methylovulum psychrotolerans]MBT9099863.1 M67 family metallopeptidase [Methylovulum psychrotolerans]POZ53155.1 CysO-cysteine peptidase [Methylovulum psychrotolerans]